MVVVVVVALAAVAGRAVRAAQRQRRRRRQWRWFSSFCRGDCLHCYGTVSPTFLMPERLHEGELSSGQGPRVPAIRAQVLREAMTERSVGNTPLLAIQPQSFRGCK